MRTYPDPADPYTKIALRHITHLSLAIGGRGSCTPEEKSAGEYVAGLLTGAGVQKVNRESFRAIPSTYWPFALGFAAALLGSICALLSGTRPVYLLASLLNLAGAWAMLAETEFARHWARWLLPKRLSQNISGTIPPQADLRARVVLCAHLDTHRTPLFYSSRFWYTIFSTALALTFLSMAGGFLLFAGGAMWGLAGMRWFSLLLIPIQAFGLAMCLHADFTPYSPGANDDASGVGVILGLASRLISEPLQHTQVHLAITGCEEVGSYGIQAYLDRHSQELGEQALYIILDEVGLGKIKYLARDGLVLKHRTHPRALALARQVSASHPELEIVERSGLAYTDALSATKRGLVALTLCCEADPQSGAPSHWHQMSDTPDTLQPDTLRQAHLFVWHILQAIDRSAGGSQ